MRVLVSVWPTLLQGQPITILDILNARKEWDVVTVRGKILNVKDQHSVGSPRKQLNLMEALLGDVTATIPLDMWESHINKVQQGKLVKVYIYFQNPKVFFLIWRICCVSQYLTKFATQIHVRCTGPKQRIALTFDK